MKWKKILLTLSSRFEVGQSYLLIRARIILIFDQENSKMDENEDEPDSEAGGKIRVWTQIYSNIMKLTN